jgi:arginase
VFRDASARRAVVSSIVGHGVDGVHLHIDADVLDPSIAPANDYAEPGGLLPHEVSNLIADIAARSTVASVSVASYDSRLDPDDVLACALIELVVGAVDISAREGS